MKSDQGEGTSQQVSNLKEQLKNISTYMKNQQEEVSNNKIQIQTLIKNPPFVNDLWESVGTLAARLTDMQFVIDETIGSEAWAKLRQFNVKTARATSLNGSIASSSPGN